MSDLDTSRADRGSIHSAHRLRGMDLNLLVSLDVLLRERSVTRAARILGLSQPALSAQLAQMRRVFVDPLLVPQRRGMVPTPRAEQLVAPLAAALEELDRALERPAPFDPTTTDRTFRIAMPDAVQLSIGAALVSRLQRHARLHRLSMRRLDLANIDAHLADGSVDAALVTSAALSKRWQSVRLMEERFVCMMRRRHPAARSRLDLDRFCALHHLLVSTEGGRFVGIVDEHLARAGRSRVVCLSVENFLIVPHLLMESDMVATLPGRLLSSFGATLLVRPLPFDIRFSLHLAWNGRNDRDGAHRWFRDQIIAVARDVWDENTGVETPDAR